VLPTATLEEYLETIYKLSLQGVVRPTQIAEAMGVSGPTVTATLGRLATQGLVTRSGTDVVLTEDGLARSLDIVRRHRIAETFLVDVLGLEWEVAHEEACAWEHALSPRVLEALERYLDNPEVCPHGHPIPSADGSVAAVGGVALSEVGAGSSAVVLRVAEENEGVLGYVGSLGLRPGARVSVTDVAPFGGPLTVDVAGRRTAIARDVARLVTVEVAE
jgi:DtxR family transcriptional regulator, Mn-dependent transcriptional regulator